MCVAGVKGVSEHVIEVSDHVIDVAERLADMADAAQGKGIRRSGSGGVRWVALSAAGAGIYALATSEVVTRQVKGMARSAKARASELPDDLLGRVQQAVGSTDGPKTNGARRKNASRGRQARSGARPRSGRKTTSARSA
jgi:hypothetical protein